MLRPFNPLASVRVAGPFGPWLISTVRPDISRKYAAALNDPTLIRNIYISATHNILAASAFRSMMHGFGWAKNPIVTRIHELNSNIPITLLYGSRSWLDHSVADIVKEKRLHSYFKLQMPAKKREFWVKINFSNPYQPTSTSYIFAAMDTFVECFIQSKSRPRPMVLGHKEGFERDELLKVIPEWVQAYSGTLSKSSHRPSDCPRSLQQWWNQRGWVEGRCSYGLEGCLNGLRVKIGCDTPDQLILAAFGSMKPPTSGQSMLKPA
ncbi:hypothetical protein NQ318_003856 [Aromia moschata]|uniref:Uncharacterized protein n=1 Tax=Aromia moschata TaxID=1265417 RepID=A0AAV8Z7P3_9CUCU|nr:hypothetical protein NQ318_003856 [Aromia moschata]